jgi:hypothetical protein
VQTTSDDRLQNTRRPCPSTAAALTLFALSVCACSGSGVPDHGVPGVTLTGCALTGYSAPVRIGTSQVFQLTVDSASTTLAVASTTCANCTEVAPLYDEAGTATGNTASTQYADGSSWNAEVYSDSVSTVGGPPQPVTLDFAAITSQTHFFSTEDCAANSDAGSSPNQGNLGLGNPDLLSPGTTSYFAQLAQTGDVSNALSVSLCLSGGTLWLGGYDATAAETAPTYTPMVDSQYWSVSSSDVLLGTQSIGAGFADLNPVTVDTATSVMVFPADVYSAVTQAILMDPAFQSAFGELDAGFFDQALCAPPVQAMSAAEIDAALPTLTFVFPGTSSGSTFQVSSLATQSYLTPLVSQGVTFYCAAVESLGTVSSGTILGDTFLQGFVTVIDIGGRQIGFAPSKPCPDPPAPPPAPQGAQLHVTFRNPHG